ARGVVWYHPLSGVAIEDLIPQELLGRPGWRGAAQVLVEPLEMGCVIQGHLGPARPVACIRVDDKPRRHAHLLQSRVELNGLRVWDTVVALAGYDQARGLEILDAV